MADNWVSPTGHNDPDSAWVDEARAYDGNTWTWAVTGSTSPLEFTIASIACDKVRIQTALVNRDPVAVDVYYDDAWHNIYEGAAIAGEWVECPIGSTQDVTGGRFNFPTGGYLAEFEFNQVPPDIPTVSADPPSQLSQTSARINGTITDDGSASCEARFRWREIGGEWTETEWQNTLSTDDPFYEDLSGLTPSTDYEYQAQARNSEGSTGWTDSVTFRTHPEPTPYVSAPCRVEVRDVDGHLIAIPRAVFSGQLTRSLNMPDGLSFQIAADDPACKYMTPRYELWVRDLSTGEIVSVCKTVMTEASNR